MSIAGTVFDVLNYCWHSSPSQPGRQLQHEDESNLSFIMSRDHSSLCEIPPSNPPSMLHHSQSQTPTHPTPPHPRINPQSAENFLTNIDRTCILHRHAINNSRISLRSCSQIPNSNFLSAESIRVRVSAGSARVEGGSVECYGW